MRDPLDRLLRWTEHLLFASGGFLILSALLAVLWAERVM